MSTAWTKSRKKLNILHNWWKRDNFRYSVMFFKFCIKKGNSYYLNIILLYWSRSQEPESEPVLKFAWSRSRKIKKAPAPATLHEPDKKAIDSTLSTGLIRELLISKPSTSLMREPLIQHHPWDDKRVTEPLNSIQATRSAAGQPGTS